MKVSLSKKYKFNAVHTLPGEEDADGRPLIHGHNYILEVTVSGGIDDSGWVFSRDRLDEVVHLNVIKPFDGGWINEKVLPASGENLALEIAERLKASLGSYFLSITLHETKKNTFQVRLNNHLGE